MKKATFSDAYPQSCHLPGDKLAILSVSVLPRLQSFMSDKEIIAASEGTQPHLEKMRRITCKGCIMKNCHLNFHHKK